MSPIVFTPESHVLVLTGAGISAESGVPTFRDAGGLWEGHAVEDVASPQGFLRDARLVWKFYSDRRAGMANVKPNAAHYALAAFEAQLGDRFLLATQNVDGLHTLAGSQRLIEMHGNLMVSRCSVCDRPPFADTTAYPAGTVPMCKICGDNGMTALLRPHIVWFGEMLDEDHLRRIERFIRHAGKNLVFIAIGTSGNVWPAAGLVDAAHEVGGKSVLINFEASENAASFDEIHLGKAGTLVPTLLGV